MQNLWKFITDKEVLSHTYICLAQGVFEGCDRRGISLLFAETIPVSYCRREKGMEVLVLLVH